MSQSISVKTPLGDLCAEIGGDSVNYPEIFLYLKKANRQEVDLLVVGVDVNSLETRAYIYGDTNRDDYTDMHHWTKEAINSTQLLDDLISTASGGAR